MTCPLTASLLALLAQAAPAKTTALDRYVAAPDASFAWKVARDFPVDVPGVKATLIEMTSQRWLTESEVDRPLWTHWLVVVQPEPASRESSTVQGAPSPEAGARPERSDIGLLFVNIGRNDHEPLARVLPWIVRAARDTGTVTAELRMVPNQPLVFAGDPAHLPRLEQEFIDYAWSRFLATGDERWPPRLPMTKSVVRAMDAVTAFTDSDAGGSRPVTRFVVAGTSKRGWTTLLTAAVDRRIVAIAPIFVDVLNVPQSLVHQRRTWGSGFENQGLVELLRAERFDALIEIEDPYSYRERLTLPKLLLNATGDGFFPPDSSRFYFDGLPGEKHLRYVPNTGHAVGESDTLESVHAFYAAIVAGTPRPEVRWTFRPDGAIEVTADRTPDAVRLWQAVNPRARDFRLETIGAAYHATALEPAAPGKWVAELAAPAEGWNASFVELTFPGPGRFPLKLTTAVRILPDDLPFPPPELEKR